MASSIIAVLTMMVSEFGLGSFPRFFTVAEGVAIKTKCDKHKRINRFMLHSLLGYWLSGKSGKLSW